MNALVIGYTSLLFVLCAGFLHGRRVYYGNIIVNRISWLIWSLIGIALLLSYQSMFTKHELYVAIGNAIFPPFNLLLSYSKHQKRERVKLQEKLKLGGWDYSALVLGIIAIVLWWFVSNDSNLSQYANIIAIVADMCALIPTLIFVYRNPMLEKPLPWMIFAVGFGMAIFAIEPNSPIVNYILPLYMFFGANMVAVLQLIHRKRYGIKESWFGQ